ncbi:hypothetical protein CP556_08725 [Natrinema sp. CBA1119]|uniref:hypothetical protein n=1 Tax=Natrinema sp. CBA1119 TaxID=1608465 RepID=UPI000BFA6315|nr:hypothetical protein [Natrinema sp. CBA1119]PGF16188.1 hypothetical protein CP556_08725 [Natrinema sp. CBA1119]
MKYIYNSPIPEAAQTDERDRLGQQLAEAGILQEDGAVVESLSSQAADLTLSGQYRWGEEISTMLADELDELSDSSLPTLPLYRRSGVYSNAGYYEIASADVEPLHANDRSVWAYTLSLTFVGKKGSYFRALETTPGQLDRDAWGNDLTSHVGVPAAASKVQWLNAAGDGTRVPASPIETRTTAAADVDVYDLTDAPWYDPPPFDEDPPTLIYTVGYADEVPCGIRAYDTRGYDAKFTAEGIRQWQTVHSTEHDIDNPVVLSNALIRLRLDEAAGSIEAETWDSGTDSWTTVGLEADQPSTVTLFDVDLETVAMARVRAQLTFDVDGELFALNTILARGDDAVLFALPENETGPVDPDLENWLSPIASTSIVDPQAEKTLVSRKEVRR